MVLSSFQFRVGFDLEGFDVWYFPTHIDPLGGLVYAPLGLFLVGHNANASPDTTKKKVSHDIMANINIEGMHPY